jgi:hypothetical protein
MQQLSLSGNSEGFTTGAIILEPLPPPPPPPPPRTVLTGTEFNALPPRDRVIFHHRSNPTHYEFVNLGPDTAYVWPNGSICAVAIPPQRSARLLMEGGPALLNVEPPGRSARVFFQQYTSGGQTIDAEKCRDPSKFIYTNIR